MIEVYYAPPSIYGRKVLVVLMEKNLAFRIKQLSFSAGDLRKDYYLKLNPNAEIPTLIDEGKIIYESTAIVEYLNEAYPQPPLMPDEPFIRAQIRMIDDFCDLHLYRSIIKCIIKIHKANEEITEQEKEAIRSDCRRIENYLGDKEFLVGDFSLADCAFMPALPAIEFIGLGPFLQSSPSLATYANRLKSRSSFKAAMLISAESIRDFVTNS
jgi:glutathione S-transferase